MLPLADRAEIPLYSDDLLRQLQQALAILADLETRYEIDRDCLENWSGPKEAKDHLLAEVERCHRHNRELLVACLAGLRQGKGMGSVTVLRADFREWV
jgi:hypothetical protein